jgi:hypothetical protein
MDELIPLKKKSDGFIKLVGFIFMFMAIANLEGITGVVNLGFGIAVLMFLLSYWFFVGFR